MSGPYSGRYGRRKRPDNPEAGENSALPLVDSIRQYLRTEGLGELEVLANIQSMWSEIVGVQVAEHAKPESLRGGELRVVVDQPAWATEFRFLSERVLKALGERLSNGAVISLKVHVRA